MLLSFDTTHNEARRDKKLREEDENLEFLMVSRNISRLV